jgi:hypothetical protein
MFGSDFYHGTMRKYVTLFGTLFNDIYITRTDAQNNPIETLKVPIAYGPKEKMLARITNDLRLDTAVAVKVPRMGFELNTLNYAPDRKLTTPTRIFKQASETQFNSQFVPVPYDMSFSLFIAVKNAEDGSKIVEQILPYFTPEFTPTVNLIPEMGITMDIPVVLINVTSQDTYEGNFVERQAIVWTLDFIVKGYFYGPVKKTGLIQLATTNFFDDTTSEVELLSSMSFEPGQTANGTATSNVAITIDPSAIDPSTDYGHIVIRNT